MRWWWTCFWEQMNLQDFTSVWDLLELLFAEILQFVSQLTNRFSQTIKRDERNKGIVIYVCRFRRCWERLETLQKTEIKLISSTQGHRLYKWKKSSDMKPIRARFLKPIGKRRLFQKKMIRWESDWWLYSNTLMKCLSVSLVSQQDLLKSTGVKSIHIHYSGRSIDTRV